MYLTIIIENFTQLGIHKHKKGIIHAGARACSPRPHRMKRARTEQDLPPELRSIVRTASGLDLSAPISTHVQAIKKRHDDQVLTYLKVCALRLSRHACVRH